MSDIQRDVSSHDAEGHNATCLPSAPSLLGALRQQVVNDIAFFNTGES